MEDMMPQDDSMLDIEFAANTEQRVPVVLILDTSGSMSGEPIEQLYQGLNTFIKQVMADTQASLAVEVCVIGMGGMKPEIIQDFTAVTNCDIGKLVADGLTPMGASLKLAMDLLSARKNTYKDNAVPYYRPWLILMTDGQPTDNDGETFDSSGTKFDDVVQRLKREESKNGLTSFFVAVGDKVNMQVLQDLSGLNKPVKLDGLNFQGLFKWLSDSMKQVSTGTVGDTGSLTSLPPIQWGNQDD